MGYVRNFFIVVGLFLLSQMSMVMYGIIKTTSLVMGYNQLPPLAIILTLAFIIGNIWLLIFLGKKLGFMTFKADFFSKKNTWLIILSAIFMKIVAYGGLMLLNMQGQEMTNNDKSLQVLFAGENPLLIILIIGISTPIMEEIVFRGAIMGFWLKKFPKAGLLISSLVFCLLHGPTDIISFFIYGLMGVTISYAYYKSQRIEVSMSIHFLNNIIPAIAYCFI